MDTGDEDTRRRDDEVTEAGGEEPEVDQELQQTAAIPQRRESAQVEEVQHPIRDSDQETALLQALHDAHADALYGYAMRLCHGDRQRAEDLVQETLLRAWRHPTSMDPGQGSVRAWLFTTARNLAIDAWRRRNARVAEVVTDQLPEPVAEVDEADRAVEAWTVAEALNRLSPAHKEVLLECFYQGRSVAEAAVRLGVPPGTVKSRTHYALRALRIALEEAGVIA